MISDTIVAPATPYGIGGIAVVRLSGPQSLPIAYNVIDNNKLLHRVSTHTIVKNEQSTIIDEAVVTFFKSPNSYTGEDVIEIACHGNPIIVDRIISACCHFGARIADPGEFTRQAFTNGKLDLVQAESVASFIHSQSEESGNLNLRLLRGELSEQLYNIQKQLLSATSLVEFELDISEEQLQPNLHKNVFTIIKTQLEQIDRLLGSYKQARILSRGALVVIAGPPNVGKSTLLNALSQTDRAITSSSPGTTRDAIDVNFILDGVPVNLVDTAGIRQTDEEIEQEGVRRAINYLKKADLILAISEVGVKEKSLFKNYKNTPVIKITNKADLLDSATIMSHQKPDSDRLYISSKTCFNIDLLKQYIKERLGITPALADIMTITTARQHRSLVLCNNSLNATLDLLSEQEHCAWELVSIETRQALNAIDAILGKTTPDDILNNIFNTFCVGK